MPVKVYGASDDLVEIEGDDDAKSYLAFSDGTVLRVTYDGMWHIARVQEGTAAYEHRQATNEDDDYSDIVTLDGAISWCVFGDRYEVAA